MPSYNLTAEQKKHARNKYIIEQYKIINNWDPLSLCLEEYKNNYDKTIIEIGSGNGNFLINFAENNIRNFYIGIEMKRKRIFQSTYKSYKRNIENIRFLFADARIAIITKSIKNNSIDEYYLTFPDPWPKKKHKRNRLIDNEFVNHIYRSLKNGGRFIIATDHNEYMKEILDSFEYHGGYEYLLDNKITYTLDDFYQSYFEKLWREMGKDINYSILIKV